MNVLDRLPTLPEWLPYPEVVWFVVEGLLIGLVGLLVRESLESAVPGVTTLGTVVIFVGVATAAFGALAWVVLVALNR